MPSREHMVLRRVAAWAGVKSALASISDRLGVAAGPIDAVSRDADLRALLELEQLRDALVAIDEALASQAVPRRGAKVS